jgi:hypothetical protein
MAKSKSKKTHETTIFTLSHSSLELMAKCPRSWFLKYVEKNYPPKESDILDFGNLCHEMAEHYYGGGLPELRRLYKEIGKKYILSPEYKEKLPIAMKRLVRFFDAKLAKSSQVLREKEFHIALDPYIDITGKVDVLYKDEGGEWVVVDYKTSKKFSSIMEQFAFYYYLITKVSGKSPKKFKFEGVYFCAGSSDSVEDFVKPVVLEISDVDISINRIDNAVETILTLDVDNIEKWKKKVGPLCNYCDYKKAGICDGKK